MLNVSLAKSKESLINSGRAGSRVKIARFNAWIANNSPANAYRGVGNEREQSVAKIRKAPTPAHAPSPTSM